MKVMGFIETQRMLNDMWRIYKKYSVRNLIDEEWEILFQEVESVYKKYKTPFTKDVIIAFLNEIERSDKFVRKGNKL